MVFFSASLSSIFSFFFLNICTLISMWIQGKTGILFLAYISFVQKIHKLRMDVRVAAVWGGSYYLKQFWSWKSGEILRQFPEFESVPKWLSLGLAVSRWIQILALMKSTCPDSQASTPWRLTSVCLIFIHYYSPWGDPSHLTATEKHGIISVGLSIKSTQGSMVYFALWGTTG